MKEIMVKEINKQINAELYSSYLYLAMAAYCAEINLQGAANWYQSQAYEEVTHAMKFYNFLIERGERVMLDAIQKPEKLEWKNLLEVFEHGLSHEKKVTDMINNLVKIARENNDYATEYFLQWYVNEQVEEEANASEYVEKLKLVGDSPQGLFMIDAELAKRPAPNLMPAEDSAGE